MGKVGIIGITGRMGQLVSNRLADEPGFDLGYSSSCRGPQDATSELDKVLALNDYIIDFSNHLVTEQLLLACIKNPKPLLICTSGWEQEAYVSRLEQAAQTIPILIARNTSLGAMIQSHTVKQTAAYIKASSWSKYDINIIEKHHRNKADAISGTSIMLKDAISKGAGKDLRLSRVKESGPREDGIIEIASVRSGGLPGEHEVIFCSEDESISISHKAFSRQIFADGACALLKILASMHSKGGEDDKKDNSLLGPKDISDSSFYSKGVHRAEDIMQLYIRAMG